MDTLDATCSSPYVTVKGQRFFDGISGIACSVRGHNPPGYAEDLEALAGVEDYHAAAVARLKPLTGLDHLVPAVSGASAVENALRLGLVVAQHPRTHVLALKGGFGGKTLFALTGTANATYKAKLDPLYADAIFVDPFAPNAIAELDRVLEQYPVGIVQMELIQGVGGVRAIPQEVVQFLAEERGGTLPAAGRWGTNKCSAPALRPIASAGTAARPAHARQGRIDMMFPSRPRSIRPSTRKSGRPGSPVRPSVAAATRSRVQLQDPHQCSRSRAEMKLSSMSRSRRATPPAACEGPGGLHDGARVRGFGVLLAIELDLQRPRRGCAAAHSIYH